MALPIFTTDNKDMTLLQTGWASQLNPLLRNPLSNGRLVQSLPIVSGINVIPHKLGRKLQGWIITRQNAAATFYDQQDSNSSPQLTLVLQSSAPVTVDIYVF